MSQEDSENMPKPAEGEFIISKRSVYEWSRKLQQTHTIFTMKAFEEKHSAYNVSLLKYFMEHGLEKTKQKFEGWPPKSKYERGEGHNVYHERSTSSKYCVNKFKKKA